MKRALTLLIILVLSVSLVAGIGLSIASPSAKATKALLSPLQFQVNGKDPYVVRIPMTQGETITGEVNASGPMTFSILLQGAVMQSESVSGLYNYRFTSMSPGTYELTFSSTRPVLVSVDIYSTP